MSSNKSMAVWCTPKAGAGPIELDVHFNYWRVANEPSRFRFPWQKRAPIAKVDFVEIGLMFDDPRKVERASIFLPTDFNSQMVCDCAPFFTDENVVQGIFNERLTAGARPGGGGPLLIKRPTNAIFCRMHRFTIGSSKAILRSELSVNSIADGTLCVIQPDAFNACSSARGASKAYFRLRIEMPPGDANPFVEQVDVPDRFLNSGYDQIDYLDFRLNEVRTLPTTIERRIANEQPVGSVVIKLVAFLTAVPVRAELSVANTEFHKMRLLEYPIWSGYARGIPQGMVVYHWKRAGTARKPIQDFSAFVKLQTRVSGKVILLKYLLFAFAFGVLGNLFASFLQEVF